MTHKGWYIAAALFVLVVNVWLLARFLWKAKDWGKDKNDV